MEDETVEEEWRPIPSAPGYEASSLGRVRCWRPRNGRAKPPERPRLVKPTPGKDGYLGLSVSIDGVVSRRPVHTLVLEAFKGPRPAGMQGRHVIENNLANNTPDNLEWGTPQQNQADRRKHGTAPVGVANGCAKINDKLAAEIYLSEGRHADIASRFGIDRTVVGKIKLGRAWAHATRHLREIRGAA
jgi:hypothetical protein